MSKSINSGTFSVQLNSAKELDLTQSNNNPFSNRALPIVNVEDLTVLMSRRAVYGLIETGVLKPRYFPGFRKPYFLISDVIAALSESPKDPYK
ncbi:MAG: hypothetical protein J7604_03565 [Sporocytophaga sp.]|uniref:hypothetical protein n=1 Tax=Sporocytophaga sp. TaxID=2231183 RepID=UPI001B1069DC|nr:hypothetical protein [Sporocytophaga sp.]MBO9699259.1 hypothetical protein [Sporocytophaga sp.]